MKTISRKSVRLRVNGVEHIVEIKPHETLVKVLRDKLGLTGTKVSCDAGECGACTVVIGGEARASCLTLAIDCEDKEITTVEGVADPRTGNLHPVQKAFIEHHGMQCGFCTPGMIMSAKVLLDNNPTPNEQEVREAINGNICRCTGYVSIIESVLAAAKMIEKEKEETKCR